MIPELIQQNFANPLGLTALLSLIPLIIFYLVKPKPEKKVMPSMTFFAEQKQEGKIRSALRKLKANKLLLFHLLLFTGVSAAIANPLLPGIGEEGSSVLVLDSSASMSNNEEQVRKYASKHLTQRNTVVLAGSEIEVLGTDLSRSQAENVVKSYEASMTSTDLVSGVRTASKFDGKMVIASDMSHNGPGSIDDLKKILSPERSVKVMDVSHENSHGFTGLKQRGGNVIAEVSNYRGVNTSLEVRKPGENLEVNLQPFSSKELVLNLDSGIHEVTLPSDEFAADNKLYVSVPSEEPLKVKQVGNTNKYFETAVKLINKTENIEGNTLSGADIYYVNNDYELTNQRLEKLSKLRRNGKSLIFEDRNDLPDFAPVENRSNVEEVDVKIDENPLTVFKSNVTGYDVKGEALAHPSEAFVLSKNGEVLINNVESEDFGEEITYPIFWKNTLLEMSDTQRFSELNLKTGQKTVFQQEKEKNGKTYINQTRITETGFYKGQDTYASNLLDAEESKPFTEQTEIQENSSKNLEKGSARKHLISLIAILSMFEILYLSRRGVFE